MSDTFEHNQGDHEDPLPEATWMIGFISTVLLIVTFLGLVALFYGAKKTAAEQLAVIEAKALEGEDPVSDVAGLKQEQRRLLTEPARWIATRSNNAEIDRRLVVPIDVAMDLVVEESNR